MITKKISMLLGAAAVTMAIAAPAVARDQIRMVGSSTVYPFATAVSEEFGKKTKFKTPVVESTGSGGGLKLFCEGVGEKYPDITNASRAIKSSEIKRCAKNGVTDIVEVKIGFDGIVFANSKKDKRVELSLRDIWTALAAKVPVNGKMVANPYKYWSDVNTNLPHIKIEVLGPPPTSGTRDAFAELAMEGGCKTYPDIKAMKKKNKKQYKTICHTIREDGAYIEAGENDNLIVGKLKANPDAFGVFGYSFLDQNSDVIQGSIIKGKEPTFENISNGSYPISRSLYFYVKKAHVGKTPGIREYLAEFTSDNAVGEYGYLTEKGLIPMPAADLKKMREHTKNLVTLSK
ncbi:Phosphate ABC transporter, periplasmic phosphate-binding protein PstS (TC 3.A.1.7.1) [hydrothermal vent metagenome]|uniref:Phosphate ABC transporter, periplasmic phosphate-binding protein PstS (TC 3.A.1.7.1) n=1 Tax=hydrothermal vent metagenome TaxID=652676 RepID=A0A3B0R365_9ZZZZ